MTITDDLVGSLPFHQIPYGSVAEAFKYGFNPEFWRFGLVFNLGNGMNVSKYRVQERLRYMSGRLLRQIYGNKYRDKAKIRFFGFAHGSPKAFDEHYHVLMGFEGIPNNWSDFRIHFKLRDLDAKIKKQHEKLVWVDYDWTNGNRYHSYVSRFEQRSEAGSDNWFVM
jgi:hypothetical protein